MKTEVKTYKNGKKRIFMLIAFIIIAATIVELYGNTYNFSVEDYWKIENGMTYEQVTEVLNDEGDVVFTDRETPKKEMIIYKWNSDLGGSTLITFTNGKVTNKSENNLKKLDE